MSFPTDSHLPHRGNRLFRTIGRFVLKRIGWQFAGALPDIPKQVVIVAPHTSNWDFIIGLMAVFTLDIRAHWIGKHTLFFPPLGFIMQRLGGIPVNRGIANDLVNVTAARFKCEERLLLGIAPEGTRKRVEQWKKGFYRIADSAGVPITCAGLDYRTRTIRFGPSFVPSGDYDRDFVIIREFFVGIEAKYPDNFHLPGAG